MTKIQKGCDVSIHARNQVVATIREVAELDPAAYTLLLALAHSSARDGTSTTIDGSSSLEVLIANGLAQHDPPDEPHLDEDARLYLTAKSVLFDDVAADWGRWGTLADHFVRAESNRPAAFTIGQLGGEALIQAQTEQGHDVIDAIEELARQPAIFWRMYPAMVAAIPYLEVSADRMLTALTVLQDATRQDIMQGMLFNAIEELAIQQHELSRRLLELLLSQSDSIATTVIVSLMRGLSCEAWDEVHARAADLVGSPHDALAVAGIDALGALEYNSEEKRAHLRQAIAKLKELGSDPRSSIATARLRSLARLAETDTSLHAYVIQQGLREDPNVLHILAQVLANWSELHPSNPIYRKAVIYFAEQAASMNSLSRSLDHCLAQICSSSEALAVDALRAWVTGHAYVGRDRAGESLPRVLHATIAQLGANGSHTLPRIVTQWMTSDDDRLHRAAADIVSDLSLTPSATIPTEITLHRDTLDETEEKDVILALLKICAYVFESQNLCTLVFSALERSEVEDSIVDLVTDLLANYVGYNYPGEIQRFLDKQRANVSGIAAVVVEKVGVALSGYYDDRDGRPRLAEIATTSWQVRVARRALQKSFSSARLTSETESPLLAMVQKVPLKEWSIRFW